MARQRRLFRRIFVRLLTILLSLTVLAVLGEVGLRLFTELGISVLVKDARVGHRYREDFAIEMLIPEGGERIALRFNRDGFRGPDRPRRKPPGVRRVAVLGDSSMAGIAVPEEQTFAGRLEQLLNAQAGQRWEVLNFGVSGHSTGQQLLVWRHFARAYEPDLVLSAFTISNDVTDNCRCTSSAHRPYFDLDDDGALKLLPMSSLRTGLSRFLGKSRLYVWQKDLFRKLRATLRSTPIGVDFMSTEPSEDFRHAWRITEKLLVQLRDEVQASGAPLLVFSVNYSVQYSTREWQQQREAAGPARAATLRQDLPDRRLKELAERHDLRWISLLHAFREARKKRPLTFHGAHWNAAGHDLAAREILLRLRGSKLLDPR